MTKKIKTSEILAAYNTLNSAKYGSMDDADKIKVWKITRVLKPIATKFDEDSKDAAEKMKPKDKDFDEKLQNDGTYTGYQDGPYSLNAGATHNYTFMRGVSDQKNYKVKVTVNGGAYTI
jgi:hypothetical protein